MITTVCRTEVWRTTGHSFELRILAPVDSFPFMVSFRYLRQPPDMEAHLRRLLGQIPRGRVTTCGALARALGHTAASRWIGTFLRQHQHTGKRAACPCHRVVRSDGSLGGYVADDLDEKIRRLAADQVVLRRGRVDLDRYCFDHFRSARPLDKLLRLQQELAARLSLRTPDRPLRIIAGVDVAYQGKVGWGALVLVDIVSGDTLAETTLQQDVRFPYISSFLAFRELPLLSTVVGRIHENGWDPDVVMVDGSGILHPRRAGIATMLGILLDKPTIGVTKRLLCGQWDRDELGRTGRAPVFVDGELRGEAILPRSGSRRPLFVSPGHHIDVARAASTVQRMLGERRLPLPIYWADRLSRRCAHAARPTSPVPAGS